MEHARKNRAIEMSIRDFCRCSLGPRSSTIPWVSALALDSHTSAKVISKKLLDERHCASSDSSHVDELSVLENRIVAAGSLLFISEYCCEAAVAETSASSTYEYDATFNACMELVESMTANDLYPQEASKASRELKHAVDMLKAELALSSAKLTLQRKG